MRLIIILMITLILTGCETTKCVLGISTKELEALRPQAIVKVVDYDLNTAYDKTLKALKEIDSYIYKKTHLMLAIYKSQTDTTPVGIFFKQIDTNKTRIEISSPSTAAKEYIADKL